MTSSLIQTRHLLRQQAINGKIIIKDNGYEVCNTVPGRVLPDSKRYINPKMENELKVFKKKIMMRFEKKEISDSFTFPRVFDDSNHFYTPSQQQEMMNAGKSRSGTRSHSLEAQVIPSKSKTIEHSNNQKSINQDSFKFNDLQ